MRCNATNFKAQLATTDLTLIQSFSQVLPELLPEPEKRISDLEINLAQRLQIAESLALPQGRIYLPTIIQQSSGPKQKL